MAKDNAMVSRRTILKSIGLVGLASLVPRHKFVNAQVPAPETLPRWQGQPIGRMALLQYVYDEPSMEATILTQRAQDDLIRVRNTVQGQAVFSHNDVWLSTSEGYIYSSFVQPIWYHLPNIPQSDLGEGRWAELTVPYSDAYQDPDDSNPGRFVSRMYYGTTFRVVDYAEDASGRAWYKVEEMYQTFYMRATHLRLIDNGTELSPLSPDVPAEEKWIDINLAAQTITAYEGDEPVYARLVSTGRPGHNTPPGTHYVWDKRISERMVDSGAAGGEITDRYNLAGVPFVCYIDANWVALHGTFWHNDYGQVRSHGCINLPSESARWFWRWTSPQVDNFNVFYVRPEQRLTGTRVEIHY